MLDWPTAGCQVSLGTERQFGTRPIPGLCGGDSPREQGEALRLREEVSQLKERLKVIERITVEKENSLAKEIESLRDR